MIYMHKTLTKLSYLDQPGRSTNYIDSPGSGLSLYYCPFSKIMSNFIKSETLFD